MLALERRDARFLELIERRDATVRKMEIIHEQHVRCLDRVREEFVRHRIAFDLVERSFQNRLEAYDLIVTVGGDGTFLSASHRIDTVPILGVVSSDASVGHFCGANVETFGQILEELLAGRLSPVLLHRLEVQVGQTKIPERALNDVLLCHQNPAATSRYLVQLNGYEEEQKSSGVWIASASGSTAAIGSAGGMVLPPRSRRIQFLVREPYLRDSSGYRLRRGFLSPRQRLVFASKMDKGLVFIDGHHITYPFGFGERLSFGLSDQPLRVFGMRV